MFRDNSCSEQQAGGHNNNCIEGVLQVYHHPGFSITSIHADSEFEPIRENYPHLQTADANDHVPEIEQYIRSMKDRVRSGY